jgi:hypothetical protein
MPGVVTRREKETMLRANCRHFGIGLLILGWTLGGWSLGTETAWAQFGVNLPVPASESGAILPNPIASDDGLLRGGNLIVRVSKSGKKISALSLKTGDLHTVTVDAAGPHDIQPVFNENFAVFPFKNKVYAISAQQGGWQELEVQGAAVPFSLSSNVIEIVSGTRHYFFVETGRWVSIDLAEE